MITVPNARRLRSRSTAPCLRASLSSFFSQFDRIWWFFFFFLGFVCVSILRNEWYCNICLATEKLWENVIGFDDFFFWVLFVLLYICLATEKMWATSRKCVFYDIFKNTTKHQKIFFEIFFEMQPNTWKHFPFQKIAFPKNGIFSGNAFTPTKHSLKFNRNQLEEVH